MRFKDYLNEKVKPEYHPIMRGIEPVDPLQKEKMLVGGELFGYETVSAFYKKEGTIIKNVVDWIVDVYQIEFPGAVSAIPKRWGVAKSSAIFPGNIISAKEVMIDTLEIEVKTDKTTRIYPIGVCWCNRKIQFVDNLSREERFDIFYEVRKLLERL